MNTVDIQKQLAARLADLLYQTPDSAHLPEVTKELAAQLGIITPFGTTATAHPLPIPSALTPATNSIGIWNKVSEDGNEIYTRQLEARMDWWLWAKVHQFAAKPAPGKKRVILLGESVARGYLYDPFYTVAQELEAQLNSDATGGLKAEVLDLARTDLGLPMLQQLLADSLQLQPDAIVIFAGNNWLHTMKDTIPAEEYQRLSLLLQKGDLSGIRDLLEDRFAGLVTRFLEFAGVLSREHGVPIVFVIPEFNLADWRSNTLEKNVTGLHPEKLSEWLALRDRGEKALQYEDHIVLDAIASGLIELDETHPLGYEWKAAVATYFGRKEEARLMLEKARDTAIYGRAETKPRCFAVVRRVINALAAGLGIGVVDLPAVFKKELNGDLPGRQLFMDYCHLSVPGIKIAMKHAAAEVAKIFLQREIPVTAFTDSGLYPDAEALAVAHIAAAVHNAHYGQLYPVLLHHCAAAARAAPLANAFMREFVDFSSRKVSNTLCKAHEKVVESGVFTQYEGGLGFIHSRRSKLLDIPLVGAMLRILEEGGEDLSQQVTDLRIAEHAVTGNRPVDLLESYYSAASYDVFNAELPALNYYQSRNSRSEMVFVSDGTTPLRATLVCRLPHATEEMPVELFLNGKTLTTVTVGATWKTVELTIEPKFFVEKGIQTLKIQWPVDQRFDRNSSARVVTPVEFLDRMYPVWGEIFSFHLDTEAVKAFVPTIRQLVQRISL